MVHVGFRPAALSLPGACAVQVSEGNNFCMTLCLASRLIARTDVLAHVLYGVHILWMLQIQLSVDILSTEVCLRPSQYPSCLWHCDHLPFWVKCHSQEQKSQTMINEDAMITPAI